MKRHLLLFVLFATVTAWTQDQAFKFTRGEYSSLLNKARNGNTDSQLRLGMAYQYGNGVNTDLDTAEYWLKTAAGFGNHQAALQLGMLYLQPGWRESHAQQAMQWFLRAAVNGYAPAENNLALMYLRGWGTKPDEEEAIRWFRKAVQHGSERARAYLGFTLVKSSDLTRQNEGFQFVREAAKRGNPEGMNTLGYCYEHGLGTTADLKEAMRWYRRAADKNNPDGIHNVASFLGSGKAGKQDLKEALRWDLRACDAGETTSCGVVAGAYASGSIVEQNLPLAYRYALIAQLDKPFLNYVAIRLSEDAIRQATAEAEQWRSAHAVRLSTLPTD